MKNLVIEANVKKLPEVLAFIDESLEEAMCSVKIMMQVDIAVEEIFVNIANYSYEGSTGKAEISIDITDSAATIVFKDSGVQFDPLAKPDPDISLPAEDRQIGGLGIFMVKKNMDKVEYEYTEGKNILTLTKTLA